MEKLKPIEIFQIRQQAKEVGKELTPPTTIIEFNPTKQNTLPTEIAKIRLDKLAT